MILKLIIDRATGNELSSYKISGQCLEKPKKVIKLLEPFDNFCLQKKKFLTSKCKSDCFASLKMMHALFDLIHR